MSTIAATLTDATSQLSQLDSPRLEAELLLCTVLGQQRSYLYTWPDRALTEDQQLRFETLLARRIAGEPVAHILGERGFWTLELKVTPDTLIPRPETELLVEAALARIPIDAAWQIADLGTGSGAIALAIASERPGCRLCAVERSAAALAVARENAEKQGLDNIEFLQGDWFGPLRDRHFDMIVSNPPYIPQQDPHLKLGDVRFEPLTALASGEDGLDDIRHIVATAPDYLKPSGWLLLEHGYDQGEQVVSLLRQAGYGAAEDLPDLQGHGRVAVGRRDD